MTQKDWVQWNARRPLDMPERQEYIKQHGLPAIIQYHEDKWDGYPDDDFFHLSIKPIQGWMSLDNTHGARLRAQGHKDYNPLHVSIGHRGDYKGRYYEDFMQELEKIKESTKSQESTDLL